MTQEIVRALVNGVWVTEVASQGGGGGSQAVLAATVDLQPADVLGLVATPFEIVAAVAGKSIIPIASILASVTNGGDYTDNGAALTISWPSAVSDFGGITASDIASLLSATSTGVVASLTLGTTINASGYPLSEIKEQPLCLMNSGSDYTDGTGVLTISLAYFLA